MKRVFLYAIPILLAAFAVLSRTSPEPPETFAQGDEEQEVIIEETVSDDVTDEELELYIGVYSEMQADHSLKLEDAITPYNITTEDFRGIERRIQNKSRLVTKVRAALLEQATQRSALTEPRRSTTGKTP